MTARAWILLLVAGCRMAVPPAPPVGGDAETDAAGDTDLPPEDVGEIFRPKDGVVIDQASPSWFMVASQSMVCLLVLDVFEVGVDIHLMGMEDGAVHPWVTGLDLPEGLTAFSTLHNIDVRGDLLYITRRNEVRAVNVRTADWLESRPVFGHSFGRFGDAYTDGWRVWPTWEAVGDEIHYATRFDGQLVATDDATLYLSAPDRPELLRVEGPDDRPAKFVMPRVPGGTLNAADIVGLQTVSWWTVDGGYAVVVADGDGRRRARHDLPFLPRYQGIACQPGPLL